MKKTHKVLFILLFNLGLFSLLYLSVEYCLHTLWPNKLMRNTYPGQYQNAPLKENQSWIQPDKDLGWILNTKEMIHSKKFNHVSYKANPQGFRDHQDFDSIMDDGTKTRIMILGDSFVFGSSINQSETIPAQLQNLLGNRYRVFNLGVPGWGIDQMYLAAQKYYELIKPDMTLLFYVDDDILRTLQAFRSVERMNKPSFKIINDRLELRRESDFHPIQKLLSNSYIFDRIYYKYRISQGIDLSKKIFSRLDKFITHRNGTFVAIHIPQLENLNCVTAKCKKQWRYFNLANFLKSEEIPSIELFDAMKKLKKSEYESYYIPNDGHLTKVGTEFIAKVVHKHLFK